MRTIFLKTAILILVALCFSPPASAQNHTATDNIIGMDLQQVERIYLRALNRGDSTYTIHYAEALFIKSEFEKAFEMYQRADALGQIETIYQKRNYQHTALRIGKQSPYAQNTGYFSSELGWIVNVSTFCANSPQEDFAPFYWKNILFITSSRGHDENKYLFTRKPFLNVHAFHDCISINLPDALPEHVNTPSHDGPIAISEDGNLFVITRNHQKESSDGIKNLYLAYYTREENSWSDSKKFPLFDIEFSVQHPFYSDSDSTLYFSSNTEGGYGGFDLYKAKWNGKSWEEPVNLGPGINSPYDEVFPALSPDGDLIYATNHIETNGGLDLVLFQNDTRFLLPEPFNTVHDDFSIAFKNSRSGYFASNRNVKGFADDIFVFDIIDILSTQYDFYVEVLDQETLEPIENAKVIFSSEVAEGTLNTSEKGMGLLHTGDREFFDYGFQLTKEGYQDKEVVADNFVERDGYFMLTLKMKPQHDFYVEVLDKETLEPIENVEVIFSSEVAEGALNTSEKGMGLLYTGDREFFDFGFQLSKEGYQDKEVVADNFVKRDDYFMLTLKMQKVVDLIEEVTLAQGYFEVFFDNDRPDPRSMNTTTRLTYQETFNAYMQRKDEYYRNSASSIEDLDTFFKDMEMGMEQLEWLARYLNEEMKQGREYTIIFTSHASALASSEYNLILSKRRFASVENFIQSWNRGVLLPFIEQGTLSYENNPFGDQQARPGVSDDRRDPARSIYSIEAARDRRVTVSWRRNDADSKP